MSRTHPSRPVAIWLTGRPAAGKSTVGRALARLLQERGQRAHLLDGDTWRRTLTPAPAYTETERDWFYAALVEIGRALYSHGIHVIFAATAHRRRHRARARDSFDRFIEVLVDCPPAECRARDPKGIYRAADAGRAHSVPGVGVPYEPPAQADLVVDAMTLSPEACAGGIFGLLEQRFSEDGELARPAGRPWPWHAQHFQDPPGRGIRASRDAGTEVV